MMMVLNRCMVVCSGVIALGLLFSGISWATSSGTVPYGVLVQMPYEAPVQPEYEEPESATPAPDQLSEQEKERLDALVPLLAGRQEFWAMGEFVHYGKHSVPYLIKALSLPADRIRYNAVETMAMIKDPTSVPALLERAVDEKEVPRVRAHAIRVATRIDPLQVVPAIAEMVKDENSTIRSTAVFEARHVPLKEILPIIISVIPDPEQFVAITARDSFWVLTKFSGSIHDWEISTQDDRKEWVQEWWDWWEEFKNSNQPGTVPQQVPTPPAQRNVS